MSGLFSRLTARTRGLELGAAQPLLPTPYETPAREPLEDFEQRPTRQRLDEAEPDQGGARSGPERAHEDGAGAARLVAQESAARSAPTEGGAPQDSWSTAAAAAEAPLLAIAVGTSTASVRRLATSTGGIRTNASAEARANGVVGEPAAEPARASSLALDTAGVSAPAPPGASLVRGRDDDALLMPRLQPRALEPRATSGSGGARGARAGADGAHARPVVKVTIGRIDVRGAPAAASSPARPAPARHVPQALDAFLRRDETRGRR